LSQPVADKQQIAELYIFRALAILAVLAIHGTSYPVAFLEKTSSFYFAYVFINIFSKFAVPAFIFLSGFSKNVPFCIQFGGYGEYLA
jgi:surface polysaccharide O-acyltransferase-like enzyme